jgi:hypothetical protein
METGQALIKVNYGKNNKAAFWCLYCLCQFMGFPRVLNNKPARYQDMLNHMVQELVDEIFIV